MSSFRQLHFASSPTGRLVVALVAVVAVGATLVVAGSSGSATASPATADPTAQGQVLVKRFFTLLRNQDAKGLKALLAPSFQVVRANGDVQNKASYLADPPKVDRFTIASLRGTQHGGVLVVSYQVIVTETIAGTEQPSTRAPRLSVFQRESGAWHLVSHANFGAISK